MYAIRSYYDSGNLDVRDGLLLDLIGLGLKTVSEISTDMILGKPEDRVEVNVEVTA